MSSVEVVEIVEACIEAQKRIPLHLTGTSFFGIHDFWYYLAIMDDRTCPTCKIFSKGVFQGSDLRAIWPYLEIIGEDEILPRVHSDKCRCILLRVTDPRDYIQATEPAVKDVPTRFTLTR